MIEPALHMCFFLHFQEKADITTGKTGIMPSGHLTAIWAKESHFKKSLEGFVTDVWTFLEELIGLQVSLLSKRNKKQFAAQ